MDHLNAMVLGDPADCRGVSGDENPLDLLGMQRCQDRVDHHGAAEQGQRVTPRESIGF